MVYTEKFAGFWVAFLVPTAVFCFCPAVLLYCRKRYARLPPSRNVLSKAVNLFFFAQKGRWHLNPVRTFKHLNDGTMWESIKPSKIAAEARPSWMTFDDQWADEVHRGFKACGVFLWYPAYWLAFNQIFGNLISQAAVMKLNGLPNDVIGNLDALALVILIPIFDKFIYKGLQKAGINFTALKKITLGFFTGAMAMVWAGVIQVYM
ncbi:hypothetical protein ABW20_dc0102721 [Dactylellina cionopaga]|nr:hypothetical protein ABW20_dc0102721 [Dactylellina cionopaga]